MISTAERLRAVGIFPKTEISDKCGIRIPTAALYCTIFFYKKQDCREQILYNTLMGEKAKCLGFELVPEILPFVRSKLRNNVVLDTVYKANVPGIHDKKKETTNQ